jgi:hypothetical protein
MVTIRPTRAGNRGGMGTIRRSATTNAFPSWRAGGLPRRAGSSASTDTLAALLFALTFTGNVDPTALATFLLAALTLAAVIVGGKALRKTQSEIDTSRLEVEEAHRPVLIPLHDVNQELREFDAPTVYRAKPRYKENNRVVVPIKNIGSGPALNISVNLALLDDTGDEQGDMMHQTNIVGLGVSEMTPVEVFVPAREMPNFRLRAQYADVAGKTWQTSADYFKREDGVYVGMSIDPVSTIDPLPATHDPPWWRFWPTRDAGASSGPTEDGAPGQGST